MERFAISIYIMIGLFITFIVLVCCDSCFDNRVSIHKSIHITNKGDTVTTFGGSLYHYSDDKYSLLNAE